MHLFRAAPLVEKLARGTLSGQQKAAYLLAGFVIFNVAYYSGFVGSGAVLWTVPYFAEAGAVVLINILGVVKAFEASGGESNKQFVVDFTCLYVPVSVMALLVVWGSYWLLRVAFSASLESLAQSDLQFAINLNHLGFDFFSLAGFMATLAVLAVTYVRLFCLLSKVRVLRGDA
jgi:hypothetical protein